jgi:hypothetical protein
MEKVGATQNLHNSKTGCPSFRGASLRDAPPDEVIEVALILECI